MYSSCHHLFPISEKGHNPAVQLAAEDAIRALQAALPPGLTKPLAPVELENVKPTLLLPPTEKGGVASELAGGVFDLGDRVACLKSTGQLVTPHIRYQATTCATMMPIYALLQRTSQLTQRNMKIYAA